jgi:FtsP/CotA-like multicopper oxidase with cupredoxin domain
MRRLVLGILLGVIFCTASALGAYAQATSNPCPRPNAGTAVSPPPDLYSNQGVLKLAFNYLTGVDSVGRTLFCFKTTDGLESPTLHVKPGDTLDITVTNQVPPLPAGSPTETVSIASNVCGDKTMTGTSLNMHFHGTNTAPTCHSDEVIHTIINSGQTFHYVVNFPANEPPGLYWYHPHVHGIAEAAVLGGASGAIIVEGIEDLQPAVAGLPERILVIRDQNVGASPFASVPVPAWDVSLNYVPVPYPTYTPAVLDIKPGQQEFWRVLNAAADTIIDLQLVYDGKVQPLQVVGLDGVPTGSQDGTRKGKIVTMTHILLAPAARAEFIITGPSPGVKTAQLITNQIDTGPDGDFDPQRPLATLQTSGKPAAMTAMAMPSGPGWVQRFEGLSTAHVTAKRKLYFSEVLSDPSNPASPTNFFITVDGATPVLFDPANPPAITTTQGSVEDWTIENRSGENHEFHMHQIHFLLLAQNGVPVAPQQQQFFDMMQVPYWTGSGAYPSVTVRMDFRGKDIGDFVYHCHILGHEDNGMMAIIRVLP